MTVEERLRDAFAAATDTVRPATLRPCPSPRQRRSWIPNGSRGLALVPLAAAAVVVATITAVSVATALLTGQAHHAPRPTASQASGLGPGGPAPRYFITAVGDLSALTVRDVHTGRITGRIAPPHGMFFPAIAATADDRTFIVAMEPNSGPCRVTLYRLQLDGQGRPGQLVPLGISVYGTMAQSGDLALTPDGRLAAYATYHCGQGHGEIGLIDLRTHVVKRWTAVTPENPAGLSLTADGRLLSFSDQLSAGTVTGPLYAKVRAVTIVLPTSAPAGAITARGRVVPGLTGAEAISLDGKRLYGCTAPPVARGKTTIATVNVYDTATGRWLRALHAWNVGDVNLCQLSRDASGRYLLVQLRSGRIETVDIATGRATQVPGVVQPVNESVSGLAW